MSLRLRLVLLTVALVTLVVLVLSGLYLNSLVDSLSAAALERSQVASQQVNAFITEFINRRSQDFTNPTSIEETKTLWRAIVVNEQDVTATLVRTMALSPALVEINVAGNEGQVLASSNPVRSGQPLQALESFAAWRDQSLYRRLVDVIVRKPDYQVRVPLGIGGDQPVFMIQVVASSVLLRDAVLPQLETVAAVATASLLVALLLTGLVTSRALRPIKRIEQTIDRIAQGTFQGEASTQSQRDEFAAVESKLNLLGQKYSGARQDATTLKHNLDEIVDRMASQLDVATRLAAISRISGGVAHEIKNPLNAISLHLDLLRARAEAANEDMIPEIDILSKEVRRLDRVVKTFLDFSRPVEVRFRDLDLAALTAEIASLMTPQARLAGIAIQCEIPPQPAYIRGDADMLKQAVLNLVTNALEALKSGGHLRLVITQTPEFVTLEVADDGPGIPREARDKVFQLYFTTKEKGSGIGLAMTYRAVQLHNGTVDFTSENDRGTSFRLQFPALLQYV